MANNNVQIIINYCAKTRPPKGQNQAKRIIAINSCMSVNRIFIRRTNIGKFGIIESLETNFQCNHHIAVFILFKILVSMITVVFK